METAAVLFAQEHEGSLPKNVEQLTNPGKDANGDELRPYLDRERLRDRWGSRLNYEYPSKHFPDGKRPALWSNGKNRINENGEGDDIANWKL